MTRIVAGTFGGRRLELPADSRVRPTADRVREAWFSILAPELAGASVVDLFAGSGALGLEALSRGGRHVTFVEVLPASLAAIRANVAALGVQDATAVVRKDVFRFVEGLGPRAFDLALADPPYTHDAAARLVDAFRTTPFARLLAVEHPASVDLAAGERRRYGSTALTFIPAP